MLLRLDFLDCVLKYHLLFHQEFIQRLIAFTDYAFEQYTKEGKNHFTVAIGCTGGQHRSVAFAKRIAEDLTKNWLVNESHRDKDRRKETVNRS